MELEKFETSDVWTKPIMPSRKVGCCGVDDGNSDDVGEDEGEGKVNSEGDGEGKSENDGESWMIWSQMKCSEVK